MYKLILFDLGGVLFTSGIKTFIESLASRYSLSEEEVREVLDGEIGTLYRESKISRDEFWKRVIKTLNLKEDAGALEKEWIDGYVLMEKTKEIIGRLKGKYKVYFLSDNVKEREEALEVKYGFKRLFDGGVFSHEAGFRKPDPRIYRLVLKKAGGEKPENTIFIDDKETALVPAREMGMAGVLFETPEKLEKDLEDLGIL